jgi:thiamine biosynthesis lipoprotein
MFELTDAYCQVSKPFNSMASPCVIHAYHQDSQHLQQAIDLAIAEVVRLEKKYSRYQKDSVLSQLNSVNKPINVDQETAGLLNYAKTCYEFSGGLFDITSGVFRKIWDFKRNKIPNQEHIQCVQKYVGFEKLHWDGCELFIPENMEIDFGGVVKEYAADQARNILRQNNIKHGLVDLGGDISILGLKPNGQPWTVGVRNPDQPDIPIATIPLKQGAIATSGYYERYIMIKGERYCHIINPKTGWPAKQVASVSVVADECIVCGSLTTVAMLKENQGAQWLKEQDVTFYLQMDTGEQFGCL